MSPEDLAEQLAAVDYLADEGLATALYLGAHVRMGELFWVIAGVTAFAAWGRVPESVRERLKKRR